MRMSTAWIDTTRYLGSHAVVTGASSGLGEEFAERLAAAGAVVHLVARRADRLEGIAARLRHRYAAQVHVIAVDITAPDAVAKVRESVTNAGGRVGILVNNAGFGTFGPFEHEDPERIAQEVDLNVRALTTFTRAFIDDLLAVGDGTVINVASTASYQPLPYMAVYAATKAYVRSFTEALWGEYRRRGLRVIALSPGPTRTEFFDVVGTDRFDVGQHLTVPQVVDRAFRELERRSPAPSVVAGLGNAVGATLARLVPRRLLIAGVAKALGKR
jgi:short-subunit dehydrogenase